eukprot:TRINITY_DN32928_c0_g1_i1.p1 TRINITY_DN32928_c0_g1~~TRINITY_DN32928_c0_g1_i1.p1  ORF type:complete len:294 (-),score=31.62 TRINITY_DN32928_c0_g1_i1:238-1119(-)
MAAVLAPVASLSVAAAACGALSVTSATNAKAARFAALTSTARRPVERRARFQVACSNVQREQSSVEMVSAEQEKDAFMASGFLEKATLMSAAAVTPFLLNAQDALAQDGEFGILEGRSVALLHPLVMGGFFFGTLYALYLGLQWKKVRTTGEQISELKKKVPAGEEGASSPVAAEIATLTQQRADLVKGNFREKHFNVGSILLGGGVAIAVEGCVNTYMRTGRLFPGPHLWAGATIVVLWAVAAAMVPAMQKGNVVARKAHVACNMLNLLLFAWQVPTGLEIVGKVFEFTSWP